MGFFEIRYGYGSRHVVEANSQISKVHFWEWVDIHALSERLL